MAVVGFEPFETILRSSKVIINIENEQTEIKSNKSQKLIVTPFSIANYVCYNSWWQSWDLNQKVDCKQSPSDCIFTSFIQIILNIENQPIEIKH